MTYSTPDTGKKMRSIAPWCRFFVIKFHRPVIPADYLADYIRVYSQSKWVPGFHTIMVGPDRRTPQYRTLPSIQNYEQPYNEIWDLLLNWRNRDHSDIGVC